jgi:single stranded DNA-binding protein
LRLRAQAQQGKKEGKLIVNLNQLSIIGFVGNHAKTKFLPIGTPVVKFSVATKKSWKREKKEWKGKTQWHNVVGHGKGFEPIAGRLIKGAHIFRSGRAQHS